MPVEGFFSIDEKRDLVHGYVCSSYGHKSQFLIDYGVTRSRMERWRKQVFAGTLELGLVPRTGGGVTSVEEVESLKRLLTENKALKDQLAAKDAELAIQRRAVDALGKAIEILHPSDASKISPASAAAPLDEPDPGQPRD